VPIPNIRLTFEKDWRWAPVAFWVHVPDADAPGQWIPAAPVKIPHKGFAMLHVEIGPHDLVFSSPAQLAHCIEVLSTKPLPTSRQLSAGRGGTVGPNGHWLSRLPAELKAPRKRVQVVATLRAAHAMAVHTDGLSFRLPRADLR